MGFNSGSGMFYCSPRAGKLVQRKKGGVITDLGYSFVGKLQEIREKHDEFEGKPMEKIELIMEDADSKEKRVVCLQFNKESWFSHGFFSRAAGIDLNKTLVVGCSQSEQNEKITWCWLKQGADTIKKDPDFPRPEKVTVGRNTLSDWTPVIQRIDPIIADINLRLKSTLKDGTVVSSDADLPFGDDVGPEPGEPAL